MAASVPWQRPRSSRGGRKRAWSATSWAPDGQQHRHDMVECLNGQNIDVYYTKLSRPRSNLFGDGLKRSGRGHAACPAAGTSGAFALNQQLRCRARADRDRAAIFPAQPHRIGGGVALLDLDRLARLEIVVLDEAEERRILIGDARHPERLADRAREEGFQGARCDGAVGAWN